MRKIESEYEIDKQKRKQRLVRNEFLYNGESVGAYDMPLIKKQDIDVEKIQLLCYADARNGDDKNNDKTIHFFTYDRKFGKVFDNPDEELEKLGQYYALFSPDFSVYEYAACASNRKRIQKSLVRGVLAKQGAQGNSDGIVGRRKVV